MKREKNSIVHAVCVGDGYLRKLKSGINYQLTISHSIKQLKFLKWKRDLLEECLGKKINIRIYERWNHDKTQKRKVCTLTVSDAKFNKVYPRLYRDKKKILTLKLLNRFDERALAIWFGDDGCARFRNDRKKRIVIHLSICEFSENDIIMLQNWLRNKWNIESRIYMIGGKNWGNKKYPRLSIHKVESSLHFLVLVKPFLCKVLPYKLCGL